MHPYQILTQHLRFLCGPMALQHSTPRHALLNNPVVDNNCVLRILIQLNWKFLQKGIFLSPCSCLPPSTKSNQGFLSSIVGQNREMHGEFELCCCLFKPLFVLVCLGTTGTLCYSAHHETFSKKKKIYSRTNCKKQVSSRLPVYCTPVLKFGACAEFPVSRIDWIRALCFPSPFSPYISPVMSHVTIALPWVSLNLRAQWLHQRAILQRSPGINLAWKRLAMNLDCLEKFSGWQLPWSAVTAGCLIHTWSPLQERVRERGHPSVRLQCSVFNTDDGALNTPFKILPNSTSYI